MQHAHTYSLACTLGAIKQLSTGSSREPWGIMESPMKNNPRHPLPSRAGLTPIKDLLMDMVTDGGVLFGEKADYHPADLKGCEDTVVGQRALMRYSGARLKGVMVWATCKGVDIRQRVDAAAFQVILARNQ